MGRFKSEIYEEIYEHQRIDAVGVVHDHHSLLHRTDDLDQRRPNISRNIHKLRRYHISVLHYLIITYHVTL